MKDTNSPILKIAFATVFVPACIYNLQLGVRIAGIYLAGTSLYTWFSGKVPVVDFFERTDHYMTGIPAKVLSGITVLLGALLFFAPGWVIAMIIKAQAWVDTLG